MRRPSLRSLRQAAALGLVLLLAGLPVLSLAGCRPRVEQLTLDALARELEWTLTPLSTDTYLLECFNRLPDPVALAGLGVHLEALTAAGMVVGLTDPISLPDRLAAKATLTFDFSLPVAALWPDQFTVAAVVAAGTPPQSVQVDSISRTPGDIFLTSLWPEDQQVDYPPSQDNHLVLSFDQPIDLASLSEELSFDPALDFTLERGDPDLSDAGRTPFTVKVRPTTALRPFTHYRLTVGAGLTTADGSGTIMGRPRGITFSTAGVHRDWWSQPPVWSPDGGKVAWVAPSSGGRAALWLGEVATLGSVELAGDVLPATPAFSADSQRVYYTAAVDGRLAVKVIDLATRSSGLLIEPSRLAGAYAGRLLSSPGGRFLAVEAELGGVDAHSDLQSEVYIFNLESGVLTRLPGNGFTRRLVGWLGERPVYAETYENYDHGHLFRYDLAVFDPVEGAPRTLIPAGRLECVADFGLAGARGAYSTWEARSMPFHILHQPTDVWYLSGLDGETPPDPARLTTGGHYRQAVPSPDGTVIAAAKVVEGSWDVVLLNPVAAGTETLIAGGPAAQSAPAWSPDGTRLAYIEAEGYRGRVVLVDPITRASGSFPPATIGP